MFPWQFSPSSTMSKPFTTSVKNRSLRFRLIQGGLILLALLLSKEAGASFDKGMRFYDQELYTHALNEFLESAEQGDARAQLMAGRLYEDGRGGDYDPEQAHVWYQKAAEQGLSEGQYLLGMQFLQQGDLPQHQVKAIGWIRKAAQQGLTDAEFQLGMMYKRGQGTGTSLTKAGIWLQKAANKGHTEAQYQMGLLAEDGAGARQNYPAAVRWHTLAAQQGHAEAALALAYLHYYGLGTPNDFDQASFWLQKAANEGLLVAQYNLAVLYEGYPRLKPNLAASLKWYREACEGGYSRACEGYRKMQKHSQQELRESLDGGSDSTLETAEYRSAAKDASR